MCLILHTTHYNCGHEIAENPQKGGLCLLMGPKQACNEIGLVRNLHFDPDIACCVCKAVRTPGQETNPVDRAAKLLQSNYDRDQNAKRLAAKAVHFSTPSPQRTAMLNRTLNMNLNRYMRQNEKKMTSVQLTQRLRYIASLPPFLDRIALVEILSPTFRDLLPEAELKTLRTSIAMLNKTECLTEIMQWESYETDYLEAGGTRKS
ncbi:hypothetical protein F4809DRAFT_654834 [Biscogniauxia mediterranea]|nr:hypothetical protein F4809DRAFT_654834 [Biscogniauxia mediterranea]